jgi:hypothetical protein
VLLRKVDGARAEVMNVIRQIEPYPGGNGEGLWLLNEANVEEKHKLLALVGCGYRSYAHDPFADIRAAGVEGVPPMKWVITGVPQGTVKHGKEILRVRRPLGAQLGKEYEFTFEIAFGQPKILDGKAVIPTLTQFVDLANGYIQLFDPWL